MGRPEPNQFIRPWPNGTGKEPANNPDVAAARLMAKMAHRLMKARKNHFGKQAVLAEKAGISRFTLSRLEAESTWADTAILFRLMTVLDLDLDLVDTRTGETVPMPSAEDISESDADDGPSA